MQIEIDKKEYDRLKNIEDKAQVFHDFLWVLGRAESKEFPVKITVDEDYQESFIKIINEFKDSLK
jgi:hypothetical protein